MAECCEQEDSPNRILRPDHPDARPNLTVRVCAVCGLRHFELNVAPGVIGVIGAKVG